MNDMNAPSPRRIWFRVMRLHHRLLAAIAHDLRDIGLSVPQFDVLSTLTEAEGLSQRELADRLYVTKGNVSGLIDRMVEAGMVERRALPGDRRSHALAMTAHGRALEAKAQALQQAFIDRTLGQLSDEDLRDLDRTTIAWRDAFRATLAPDYPPSSESAADGDATIVPVHEPGARAGA